MDRELLRDAGVALLMFLIVPAVMIFPSGKLALGLIGIAIGLWIGSGRCPSWGLKHNRHYLCGAFVLMGTAGVVIAIDDLIAHGIWMYWVSLALYLSSALLILHSSWSQMLRSLFSRYGDGEQ